MFFAEQVDRYAFLVLSFGESSSVDVPTLQLVFFFSSPMILYNDHKSISMIEGSHRFYTFFYIIICVVE